MIYYDSGGMLDILERLFWCRGSVFKQTALIALPAAIACSVLQVYFPDGTLTDGILRETQAWSGFTNFLGFLMVFRTSQAYNRFWDGCTAADRMRAEWFEATSSLMAFTKLATASAADVQNFKELIVRLVSMLHASALADLESGNSESAEDLWAHSYEIIDPGVVDLESIASISSCDVRTELLFAWVQQLITEHIASGVLAVPSPILTRTFQELSAGMMAFHDAMRISHVPFPFPYAQACDCILIIYSLLVPAITSQWVTNVYWAAIFSFVQVFILWSLNLIAMEIDQPFGRDTNDIDGERMQREMNMQLTLLLTPNIIRTPSLSRDMSVTGSGGIADFGRFSNDPRMGRHSAALEMHNSTEATTLNDLFAMARISSSGSLHSSVNGASDIFGAPASSFDSDRQSEDQSPGSEKVLEERSPKHRSAAACLDTANSSKEVCISGDMSIDSQVPFILEEPVSPASAPTCQGRHHFRASSYEWSGQQMLDDITQSQCSARLLGKAMNPTEKPVYRSGSQTSESSYGSQQAPIAASLWSPQSNASSPVREHTVDLDLAANEEVAQRSLLRSPDIMTDISLDVR